MTKMTIKQSPIITKSVATNTKFNFVLFMRVDKVNAKIAITAVIMVIISGPL